MQDAKNGGAAEYSPSHQPSISQDPVDPPADFSSSSLEPLETTGTQQSPVIDHPRYCSADHDSYPPANSLEQCFRHSGWAATRQRVYNALVSTHQSERRLDAFCNCGNALFLNRDGSELVLTANFCRDRLCEPCQLARRSDLIEQVCLAVADAKDRVRFATLTLRATSAGFVDQLDRLHTCFKALRKRPWWRETVTGGAMFIEAKLGKQSGAWHVHAHLLIEGTFIDQRKLSAEWLAVTGDSYIVDVRAITDPLHRARYVTKYATKPCDHSVTLNPAKLEEFVTGVKGKRLYQTFGRWKGFAHTDEEKPKLHLTAIGSVSQIFSNACDGDADAKRWVDAMVRKWPRLGEIFLERDRPPPNPLDL